VTFTATVSAQSPGAGTPTGQVQWQLDSVNTGPPFTLSGGTSSMTTTQLTVASHQLTAMYLGDANFAISSGSAAQTVNKAAIAVMAPSLTMTYGDSSLPGLAPAITSLQNSDTFGGLGGSCSPLTSSGTAFILSSGTNAGAYTVRCSGVSTANYAVTYTDGQLTVNPTPLTVTADDKGPVQYSDPLPPLTATLSGFRNAQTLATSGVMGSPSCTTEAGTTTVTVGQRSYPYAITCKIGSLSAQNYTFPAANFKSGSLTVSPETAAIQYTGGTSV